MKKIYIWIKGEADWYRVLFILKELNLGIQWPAAPFGEITKLEYPRESVDILTIYIGENQKYPLIRFNESKYIFQFDVKRVINIDDIHVEICDIP